MVFLVHEGNESSQTQTLTESEYNYIKVDYLKCQNFRCEDFSSLNINVMLRILWKLRKASYFHRSSMKSLSLYATSAHFVFWYKANTNSLYFTDSCSWNAQLNETVGTGLFWHWSSFYTFGEESLLERGHLAWWGLPMDAREPFTPRKILFNSFQIVLFPFCDVSGGRM